MLLNLIQFVLQIVGMVAIGFGLIVAFEGALNALRRWSNARQDLAPHAAVLEAARPTERRFGSPGHVGTDRGRSGYQDPALGDYVGAVRWTSQPTGPQPENLYAKAEPFRRFKPQDYFDPFDAKLDGSSQTDRGGYVHLRRAKPMPDCP